MSCLILLLLAPSLCLGVEQGERGRISYPEVKRDDSVFDSYFGTKVLDPYRALEDLDSEETRVFVEAERNITEEFLRSVPSRESIRERLRELWNYPKSTTPVKAGGRYFVFENTGLQNHHVLYVQEGLEGERRVLLDVNKLSADGSVSMEPYAAFYDISKDGELFAYSTTESGSDWKTIRFKNVSSGEDFEDTLLNSKFPFIQWAPGNGGVFYTRLRGIKVKASDPSPFLYYHKLGTSQDEDILVAEFPDHPLYYLLESKVTEDGKYLMVTAVQEFSSNAVYLFPLKNGIDSSLGSRMIPIFPDATDAFYKYIGNQGNTFLFQSNKDAPNYKLISVSINDAPQATTTTRRTEGSEEPLDPVLLISTFLPEHPTNVINFAEIVDRNKLVLSYVQDVKHSLELRSLKTGKVLQKLDVPVGAISGISYEKKSSKEFFYPVESFLSPITIYRCIVESEKANCKVFKQVVVGKLNMDSFVLEQKFYRSKDSTAVPMYIVRKKSTPLDGTAPTLLWGYGGFNVPVLPSFSIKNLAFVEHFNGIYVVANIRGGGEYGRKWYEAGSRLNKQNSFDDFHAAAEYLISNNYTSPSRLTIEGKSNGGLLVGACINQRPELYGAGIVQVGVLDMLRISQFETGLLACSEYGCPTTKEVFQTLLSYSPLHNVRVPGNESVQYPAVLVSTGHHDNRVPPLHSYKFVAELQHTVGREPRQTNPLLLRVDQNAGHGLGKPTSAKIDEATDFFAFIAGALCLEFKVSQS